MRELVLEVVARKQSRELSLLADEFDKTARKAESAGKSFGHTASFSQFLDGEISKTKTTIRELGQEFDRTGNKDVFAKLRGAQTNLGKLEGIKKQLGKALEDAGQQAAPQLTKGLSTGLSNPEIWAIGAPAIAAAAIPLGEAVGAAILTGIGLAGVGAGIAGQLSNPEVRAAGTRLGKQVSADFKDATSSFADPLRVAIDDANQHLHQLQPGLKSTFAALSPLVADLEHGAVGFIDALVPGLEHAAVAAKPLVQDLAAWLPRFGSSLAHVFDEMAAHSQDLEQGLHLIEDGLNGITTAAGYAIPVMSGLAKTMTFLEHYGPFSPLFNTVDSFHQLASGGTTLGRVLPQAAEGMQQFGSAAGDAENNLQALQDKLTRMPTTLSSVAQAVSDKLLGAMLGVDQANLGVAESLTRVTEALKTNKHQLDIHTAAGQADREAVLAAVAANVQQYDSLIQSGIGAEDAAKAYDQNTAALERQLRKAGLTSGQIDGLIGKYRNVPHNVDTVLATQGLTEAINDLSDLLKIINHIPRQKLVEVDYVQRVFGAAPSQHFGHRAAGGPVVAGGSYVVGEKGPELFTPSVSGSIVPNGRSMVALSDTPRYGSAPLPRGSVTGRQIQVNLNINSGGAVAVGTMFRELLRTGVFTIDAQWIS